MSVVRAILQLCFLIMIIIYDGDIVALSNSLPCLSQSHTSILPFKKATPVPRKAASLSQSSLSSRITKHKSYLCLFERLLPLHTWRVNPSQMLGIVYIL